MSAISNETSLVKTDIKIPSKTPGWDLHAWKYLPNSNSGKKQQGLPVIVMAHGFSSNKSMGLAKYAEVFASLGYAVVVFDYRRWGTSAGAPRHVLYISEQLDDYRTVVKYCRQQSEFDPQKVILWGTSFAGGHVVTLASERNLNITAAIAQCPFLGNSPTPKISWGFLKTILKGIQDVIRQTLGLSPTYITAAALPGSVGIMTTADSLDGIQSIVQEGIYPNEVNASALFDFGFYNPATSAAGITCPVQIIAAEDDSLCPYREAQAVGRKSNQVTVIPVPCKHFELYPGAKAYEQSLTAMKEFLSRYVIV